MKIEPLDAEAWFSALRKLENRRRTASASDLEQQLRHAYHLQQLAPRPLRKLVRSTYHEAAFENLLENRAYAAASEALVGPPLSCNLRVLGEHHTVATVHLPGDAIPTSVCAPLPATAVLGAWLCCLERLESFTLAETTVVTGSAKLKVSAGPRFSSTH